MATPTSFNLHCVVVTPERALLDTLADFIAIPMADGELGVLPGRAPLIGRLGFGELRLRRGQQTTRLYVDGGFVQIRGNTVSVLTSRAVKAEEIKPEAVHIALEKAQEALHKAVGQEAQDAQTVALQKARSQIRVSRHRTQEPAGETTG